MEVKGQRLGIYFLLALCGLWAPNSDCQACLQVPFYLLSQLAGLESCKMVSHAWCHLVFTEVLHDVPTGRVRLGRPYRLSDTVDLVLGAECFIPRQFFPVGHECSVSAWRGVIVQARAKGTWIGENEEQAWEELDDKLDGVAHTCNLSSWWVDEARSGVQDPWL